MAFANAQEAVAALAARSASLADLREIVTRFPQLRPVVAAFPQTDQPLLEWLGSLRDPLIDAQLAKRSSSAGPTPPPAPVDTTVWAAAGEDSEATGPATPLSSAPTTDSDSVFRPDEDEPTVSSEPPTQVEQTVVQPLTQSYPVGPGTAQPSYPASYEPSHQMPAPSPGYFATPPTPQAAWTVADQPPGAAHRKRRVLPAVLITLLALAVVGGGLWAVFATGLLGGSGTAATKPAAATVAPPSSAAGPASSAAPTTPAPTTPAPASVTPSTPTPPAPAAVVCWDGSMITDGSACPTPSGKDADWTYLKYAYPSIATQPDCEQVASKGAYSAPTVMWECELGDALIRYRYWESNADADAHYGKKFTKKTTLASYDLSIGGTPATGWIKTDKKTADGPDGIKRVVLTMWLPDQHLSMSVEGNTKATMWAAFDLARIRPLTQILGHREGTEPDEAAITAIGR